MGWSKRLALWLCFSVAAAACAPKPQPAASAKAPPREGGAAQPPGMAPDQPVAPAPVEIPDSVDGDTRELETVDDAEAAIGSAETELDGLLGGTALETLATSRCVRLCRSLSSMGRAVDSLCELTGDGDERCESARKRLASNKQRVSDAGCAC